MEQGFLNNWLICGPFYSDRGWAALDEDYLFGEARVVPRQGMRSFGKEWIPWDTEDNYLQFLFAPFEHTLFCTAYAHSYVYSPQQTDAMLLCGSDDGIAVWINGESVWYNDANRACVPGDDRARITLNEGWNSVLVKVRQGMAHWQFVAQILDLNGKEIPGLTCSREADYPASDRSTAPIGVRIRFFTETYECIDGSFKRTVQFEAGNLDRVALQNVSLLIGSNDVTIGNLEPGETRVVSKSLGFDEVLSVMKSSPGISASVAGQTVSTVVALSKPSRLLRDLFAPFFIPSSLQADLPGAMRAYPSREFARDENGQYVLVDPVGLRHYLGGLVGRLPMAESDEKAASRTCEQLLAYALAGETSEFSALLGEAKLPKLGDS